MSYYFTTKSGRDALIVFAFVASILIVGTTVDLFEQLVAFTESYETYQLDEIIIVLLSAAIGMLWFSYRRTQEVLHVERVLKVSEVRLQKLFSKVESVAVLGVNQKHKIIYWNKACEVLYGYPANEVLGMPFEKLMSVELMQEQVYEDIGSCLSGESLGVSGEVIRVAKGGEQVDVFSNMVVLDDLLKVGGEREVFLIDVGLSELRRAQSESNRLNAAIDQADESFFITDTSGRIEYINAAFSRITGFKQDEVLGVDAKDFKLLSNSGFYRTLQQGIELDDALRLTHTEQRKNGSTFPATTSIAPIRDLDGKITNYIGIQQDLSTMSGVDEKFRQSQKMEALGTLVGGIAHDFNNTLGGMTGNLFLAKSYADGNEKVLDKISKTELLCTRAAGMIKQLLVFARLSDVEMKCFELRPFMKETLKLSEVSIPENIHFHFEFCKEKLLIKGDPGQLQQMFMNLLNNARDAVKGGESPNIVVSMDAYTADETFKKSYPETKGDHFVHLKVIDNGHGISSEHIEQVFTPFFTTKEVGKGTGLGLAMVYGVVKTHHGAIYAESQPNEGTTIHIYLPQQSGELSTLLEKGTEELYLGEGETILLVDDDDMMLEVGQEVLERLGYRVLTAEDGKDAIEMFTKYQDDIDLILTDVVMPRLQGVEAVRRIRAIAPNVKVIFATGYDSDAESYDDMPKHQQEVILDKPYDVGQMSRALYEKLNP